MTAEPELILLVLPPLTVKAGYPPRPLLWTSLAQPFASLKLSRDEQLIVSVSTSSSGGSSLVSNTPALKPLSLPTKSSASAAPLPRSTAPPAASPPRAPVTSRAPAQPATSRSADGAFVEVDGSYLVLNIVPYVAVSLEATAAQRLTIRTFFCLAVTTTLASSRPSRPSLKEGSPPPRSCARVRELESMRALIV